MFYTNNNASNVLKNERNIFSCNASFALFLLLLLLLLLFILIHANEAFWTSDSPKNSTQPRRIAYNDPMVTKVVEYLESNVDTIREEYLRVAPTMNSDYDGLQDHNNKDNSKLHEGQWDWYTYLSKG